LQDATSADLGNRIMTIFDLQKKLYESNVPERWYSLNQGLKPDALILYKNYSHWEFFYLSEKGDKLDFKLFLNESDAFEYFWKKILKQLDVFDVKPKTN
jgi:hypothetical protein